MSLLSSPSEMSTLVQEPEARLEPGDLPPLCMGQDDPRPRSPARLRLRSQEGSILPLGSVEPRALLTFTPPRTFPSPPVSGSPLPHVHL